MRTLVILLAFLFVLGISRAMVVGPAVYEQKDIGSSSLPQLIYSLSVDCNASVVTAIITDGKTNQPVQGVDTYLSYVDFTAQLLTHVLTDHDGYAVHKLPGQTSLMQGMFILDLQKYGYQSKEVHFDLYPCLHNGQLPPPPTQPAPPNVTKPNVPVNYTVITTIIDNPIGQDNTTAPILTVNSTSPPTTNSTSTTGSTPANGCPAVVAVLLLICVGALTNSRA